MANHNQQFRWCDDCVKVVRVDIPECVHFGAFKAGGNVESTTVIFRSPDGKVSIPWEPTSKCPKGYIREEVRGAQAVRKLERELDAKDYSKFLRHQEKMERILAPNIKMRRDGLQQIISQGIATVPDGQGGMRTIHVSEFGKSLAREALKRQDRGYSSNYDAGNHHD